MVAAALRDFAGGSGGTAARQPLADLPPTPGVLAAIRRHHLRQYRPRAALAVVADWLRSRGGRPEGILGRLRLAGKDADPHVLCFGPAPNRRFLRCLARAHAVAPYRIEAADGEVRVYVYDPNHPKDRGRYVSFERDRSGRISRFSYCGFGTREGWGLSLLPLSAIGDTAGLPRRAIL